MPRPRPLGTVLGASCTPFGRWEVAGSAQRGKMGLSEITVAPSSPRAEETRVGRGVGRQDWGPFIRQQQQQSGSPRRGSPWGRHPLPAACPPIGAASRTPRLRPGPALMAQPPGRGGRAGSAARGAGGRRGGRGRRAGLPGGGTGRRPALIHCNKLFPSRRGSVIAARAGVGAAAGATAGERG